MPQGWMLSLRKLVSKNTLKTKKVAVKQTDIFMKQTIKRASSLTADTEMY